MGIRENIIALRTLYNVTQEELAAIAGVSRGAVSQWEGGFSEPRMGAIQKIADHYHILKSNIIEDGGMDSIDPITKRPRVPNEYPPGAIIPTPPCKAYAPLLGRVHAGGAAPRRPRRMRRRLRVLRDGRILHRARRGGVGRPGSARPRRIRRTRDAHDRRRPARRLPQRQADIRDQGVRKQAEKRPAWSRQAQPREGGVGRSKNDLPAYPLSRKSPGALVGGRERFD